MPLDWHAAEATDWGPDPIQHGPVPVDPSGTFHRRRIAMNAAALKEQIEKGEYQVDPAAVADAMLRRLRVRREARECKPAQNECSYPESSPSASVNTTPGGPSTIDPIHVRSVSRRRGPRAFSNSAAVGAGMQAHSS